LNGAAGIGFQISTAQNVSKEKQAWTSVVRDEAAGSESPWFLTQRILERLCNEFRVKVIGNSIADWAQDFIYPAFPQIQIIPFNGLQFNQHLALNVHSCENWKKCSIYELSTITITLSTPQTLSTLQLPITTPPPMIDLKYWRGYLH